VQDDSRLQQDTWVTSFVGRLQALIRQALIRNVGGSRKK
jgi:hypothetical protein